jgi:BirA family biotin operon repressor/biotin-[acetyl-CoA-carboxylase] ligase
MGAVATAEVVTAWTGREAAIKWPNDVRVDGRKIAGILVERPAPHGFAAVIGIGLNVNLDVAAFPVDLLAGATSIRIERGGNPADRSEVARDLIRRLDHWYQAVRSVGGIALNAAWRDRNEHLGRLVRVATPGGSRSGRLVDLDLHLGLTLEVDRATEGGPAPAVADRDVLRPLIRLAPAEIQAIETTPSVHDA